MNHEPTSSLSGTDKAREMLASCPVCHELPQRGFMGDEDEGYGYCECTRYGHFIGFHMDDEETAVAAWRSAFPLPSSPLVGEELVVVPKEPTREMVEAAPTFDEDRAVEIYRAMIAAASATAPLPLTDEIELGGFKYLRLDGPDAPIEDWTSVVIKGQRFVADSSSLREEIDPAGEGKLPLQDRIETILIRRLCQKRIDGYTLETAHEIAATISPSSVSPTEELRRALEAKCGASYLHPMPSELRAGLLAALASKPLPPTDDVRALTDWALEAALDAEFSLDAGGDAPAADISRSLGEILDDAGLSKREQANALHVAFKAALSAQSPPPADGEWDFVYRHSPPPADDVRAVEPVAWRWRYLRPGSQWYINQSPVQPREPDSGHVGIEVEPLYLAPPVQSPPLNMGEGRSGYVEAFYDLASLMGIGARVSSPKETWEREMRPRLVKALATPSLPEGMVTEAMVQRGVQGMESPGRYVEFRPDEGMAEWLVRACLTAALATSPSSDLIGGEGE